MMIMVLVIFCICVGGLLCICVGNFLSCGTNFQVLEHVRLPLLSPKFLVGTVGSDLLIKSDEVRLFSILHIAMCWDS